MSIFSPLVVHTFHQHALHKEEEQKKDESGSNLSHCPSSTDSPTPTHFHKPQQPPFNVLSRKLPITEPGVHVSQPSIIFFDRTPRWRERPFLLQETRFKKSKYLAELLLDYACKRLSVDARIAQVGQIAGSIRRQGI